MEHLKSYEVPKIRNKKSGGKQSYPLNFLEHYFFGTEVREKQYNTTVTVEMFVSLTPFHAEKLSDFCKVVLYASFK